MDDESVQGRLTAVLRAAAPLIRNAPPRAPERPDHRAWEDLRPSDDLSGKYQVLAAINGLSAELLGQGQYLFGGPWGSSGIEAHYLRIAMAERIALGIDPAVVASDMRSGRPRRIQAGRSSGFGISNRTGSSLRTKTIAACGAVVRVPPRNLP